MLGGAKHSRWSAEEKLFWRSGLARWTTALATVDSNDEFYIHSHHQE